MTFHFGSTEDQANLYWENALSFEGPAIPSLPLDELSLEEARSALAYARLACMVAEQSDAPDDVYQELVSRHDAVFAYVCSIDDDLRDRVLGLKPGRKPIWLGGTDPDNIQKYLDLASAN